MWRIGGGREGNRLKIEQVKELRLWKGSQIRELKDKIKLRLGKGNVGGLCGRLWVWWRWENGFPIWWIKKKVHLETWWSWRGYRRLLWLN